MASGYEQILRAEVISSNTCAPYMILRRYNLIDTRGHGMLPNMRMSRQDRQLELDAFKTVNLGVIASEYGYRLVPKKTNKHSVFMASSNDKIIIGKNGPHYVYWSVFNERSNGTAIDFVQNVIEPGCSLPRVREILRPFIDTKHYSTLKKRHEEQIVSTIRTSPTNFLAVAGRHAQFEPITASHPYLCGERHIPYSLLLHERLEGKIQHCPKRGNIIFPHYGLAEQRSNASDWLLTGYEIKGRGINMFSKSGRKGIWSSAKFIGDTALAVTESGLDALSYLALHNRATTRVVSISGQLNAAQPELIKIAIEQMGEGAIVAAAFDNDEAGDKLTQKLADILKDSQRSDIQFVEDRPKQRGADWNDVLREDANRTIFSIAANSL